MFVTTETASTSIVGIAYGPDAHIFVSIGRIAPISGYAPESCTIFIR